MPAKRSNWIWLAVSVLLCIFLAACGSSPSNNTVTSSSNTTDTSDSGESDKILFKVPAPQTFTNPFCARIRVTGTDFPELIMDSHYPASAASIEGVVPNIPMGDNRSVELGLFTNDTCGDLSLADWYGKQTGVIINASDATIVQISLQKVQQPPVGSIIVRGGKTYILRRLHGEVVQRNTTPIGAVSCRIMEDGAEIGIAASGTDPSNIGVLNTLIEVNISTIQLELLCSHPLYSQASQEFANLVMIPNDPLFGTFTATVEMNLGSAFLGIPTIVNGQPARELPGGNIILLNRPEDVQWYQDRFKPPPTPPLTRPVRSHSLAKALPATVNLLQYQTPVKNQGARGTCIDFAAAAAIEAAYKRDYNLTLDLSEEWVNHIRRMDVLDTLDTVVDNPKSPDIRENDLGVWGYGTVNYILMLFARGKIGIPEESAMPYLSYAEFDNTIKWTPAIGYTSPQRAVDDVNLSQGNTIFNIPYPIITNMFPQHAQDTAKYRPANSQGAVLYAEGNDLTTLNWYKSQLAYNHEVAFGVTLNNDDSMMNDIWMPGTDPDGGHAMLMVGYDDSKQAFRVKNSWGTGWGEKGYIWFSYDWITKGKIYEAAAITSLALPNLAIPTEQLFFGRYNLDHDGWQGILDIYHIPDSKLFSFKSGASDTRLGTYYGPDNIGRRVNGTINGRRIDFYIDWGNTGARGYGDLSGMHFTGYLSGDNQTIAGKMLDNRDGQTYGFYGRKHNYLSGEPGGSGVSPDSYKGNWQVYGKDIPDGSFAITAINPNTGEVTGTEFGGALSGTVNISAPRIFNFQLQGHNYNAYLFDWETGVMAGTVDSGNNATGFVALRSDFSKPQVSIQTPENGSTLTRTQSYNFDGQARGDNGSGFIMDLPCNWTSSDAGDNQFPISNNCKPTIKIRQGGTASVTFTLSATAYGNVSAQTSVTVYVNNPSASPVPSILNPKPGAISLNSVSDVFLNWNITGGTFPFFKDWYWKSDDLQCTEIPVPIRYDMVLNQIFTFWEVSKMLNIPNGCGLSTGRLILRVTDTKHLTGEASVDLNLTYFIPPN